VNGLALIRLVRIRLALTRLQTLYLSNMPRAR
jgi:hypothetical protein